MFFFKYILSISMLFLAVITASGQTILTLNTPQDPDVYEARDNVKLDSIFEAKSSLGSFKIATNPNLIPLSNYTTFEENGEPVNQIPFNTFSTVGTIQGTANVNEMGAAIYTIPLKLTKGSAGLQPPLNIHYNSQSGNGIVGTGWKLDGISSIEIVSENPVYDFNEAKLNPQGEGYAIDGQRLIVTSGTYGEPGSVYSVTNINFDKIEIPADGNGFILSTKDGKTLQYGIASEAQILGGNLPSSVFKWYLNKITDANKNYIQYNYAQEKGEGWIKSIEYTGNESGPAPYAKVLFYYELRKDTSTVYISRGKIVQKRILTSIVHVVQNQQVLEYDLMYAYNGIGTQLSEIKLSGIDNGSFNTTKFKWETSSKNITSTPLLKTEESLVCSGDFDGNGSNDCITFSKLYQKTKRESAISMGDSGWYWMENNVLKTSGVLPHAHDLVAMYSIDVENDGKTELLCHFQDLQNNVTIALYQMMNGVLVLKNDLVAQQYTYSEQIQGINFTTPTSLVLGDFDGNHKTDIILLKPDKSVAAIIGMDAINTAVNTQLQTEIETFINLHCTNATKINQTRGQCSCEFFQGDSIVETKTFNPFRKAEIIAQNFSAIKNLTQVIDVDGNGKSEIIVVKDSATSVYNLSETGVISVYETNDIFNNLSIQNSFIKLKHHFEDYNGDKKTDLLTYKSTDSLGNGTWEMRLSDGQKFGNPTHITLPVMDINFDNWQLLSTDLNLDDKPDILLAQIKNSTILTVNSYLLDSKGFIFNMQIAEPLQMNISNLSSHLFLVDVIDTVSQFKRKELLLNLCGSPGLGTGCQNKILNFNQKEAINLVKKITDGFNNETIFSYANISDSNLYTKNGPSQTVNNVSYIAISPKPVVSKLQLSTDEAWEFKYTGLLNHTEGRGILGFAIIEKTNTLLNQLVIQENTFDNYLPYPFNTTIYTADKSHQINSTAVQKTYLTSGRFIHVGQIETTEIDYLSNSRIEKIALFDVHGNQTNNTSKTYDASSGGSLVYEKVILNEFDKKGSYLPNVVVKCSTSTCYKTANATPSVEVINYTYDDKGNTESKTNFYQLPNAITVNYGNRDLYGNPQLITTSAADVMPKTIINQYDITGRFVEKTFNPLNQCTTLSYDAMGNVLTETEIDGNTIEYTYDGFGRLKTKTNTLSSSVMTQTISWESNLPNVLYKHTTTVSRRPSSVIYFDKNEREVKTTIESFGKFGVNSIATTKEYYPNGFLKQVSDPFYESDASNSNYTTYTYDPYHRVEYIQKSAALNGTKIEYNEKTIQTTDQAGRKSKQLVNALGKIISTTDIAGNTITYEYNNQLHPTEINVAGVITKIEYDEYGRKASILDPNTGTTLFKYDSYDRLYEQQDPAFLSTYTYDVLDRLLTKTIDDETISYSYITSGNGINKLSEEKSTNGSGINYEYNQLGSTTKITESNPEETFITQYDYDFEGKEIKHTYPTGFATENVYDYLGNIVQVVRADNDEREVIWELNELAASGNLKEYGLGKKGIIVKNTFNNLGLLSATKVKDENAIYLDASYVYDPYTGNMTYRNCSGIEENFSYDNMNRLTNMQVATNASIPGIAINYSSNGNIVSKTDVGTYSYNYKPYAISKITNQSADFQTSTHTITYNALGKVKQITEGNYGYIFSYGVKQEPYKMTYSDMGVSANSYSRFYATSFEKNIYANHVSYAHYISTPFGENAVYIKNDTTQIGSLMHIIHDHQGSFLNLMVETGEIKERNYYDAWGRKGIYVDSSGVLAYNNSPGLLSRAYKGIELLAPIGLLNFKGILYDPQLGRILNPATEIYMGSNSQVFNRYSYNLNNPLK